MTDTTANIGARGTDGTGLTEDMASEMFHGIGRHWMAIVELQAVEPHGPNLKGKRKVSLVLTQIEVAEDDILDDHLRNLTRTLHQNRALKTEEGQLAIQTGDGINPKPADVIAAGKKLITHEYVDAPDGVCDVCGNEQDDRVHTIVDALPDPDEETGGEPDNEPEADDEDDSEDQGDDEQPAGNVTQLGSRSPAFSG